MTKDTFWSIRYKGCDIRGHYDHVLKKEIITILSPKGTIYDAPSIHAAKYKITRHILGSEV